MDNTIQSDLIRGHINTIILKALYDGDRYGFDIIKEIEQKSSGQYILKQPTLYSCLKRLEVQGFIKSYWGCKSNGGRRKYYTLTDMGKDLFIKNQTEWEYSRTVIDKLISDKDFDLSSVSSQLTASEDENKRQEDLESEFNDFAGDDNEQESLDTANSQSETGPVLENGIINGERFSQPAAETEEKEQTNQTPQPVHREYLDTTAIMNELFEQQMRTGESYTEKLKNEKYVPTESLKSDSYFNNDYLNRESGDAGEAPAYDTEEILNGFDNLSSAPYVPPAYIPTDSETDSEILTRASVNQQEETTAAQSGQPTKPDFYSYSSAAPAIDEKSMVINREYKNILSQLRSNNVVESRNRPSSPSEVASVSPVQQLLEEEKQGTLIINDENSNNSEEADQDLKPQSREPIREDVGVLSNDKLQTRNFQKLASDVKDLGDGIKIRTHNGGTAKEYASTYYFYSNKLMLSHYLILFVMMLLEITVAFLAIRLGNPIAQKNGLLFYILAVVLSLAFPVAAFIMNLRNPEKRKRVSFNFKMSLLFRFIVMVEALVLIYAVNLMMGMPLTFDTAYLTTLLIPALMATNIPVSSMVFQSLYKSGKYNVEN